MGGAAAGGSGGALEGGDAAAAGVVGGGMVASGVAGVSAAAFSAAAFFDAVARRGVLLRERGRGGWSGPLPAAGPSEESVTSTSVPLASIRPQLRSGRRPRVPSAPWQHRPRVGRQF
jgi:hypothetical protein